MNSVHESCLLNTCKFDTCKNNLRGLNYYIDNTDKDKQIKLHNCLITFWGFTHFLLYFILGLLYPKYFWQTFFIGAGFELYEKLRYDCHDVLDIVLNTAGFILGFLLSTRK